MRDCKGNKILLAICPSKHRSKDFLPRPELWSRRLSLVSFLLTIFVVLVSSMVGFLSLPLRWVFFVFDKLGFFCAWPPPHSGQPEVVSARLNPRNGTIYVGSV